MAETEKKKEEQEEIVGDLIIIDVKTPEPKAKQELRKRGFMIACVVKEPKSKRIIFSVKCGPKLIVHQAVEHGFKKKKANDYASHELARIAVASMEVIKRMKENQILKFSEILLQHKVDELKRAKQDKLSFSLTPNLPDPKFLNQYYGSQVALYFTWAKFYTEMLIYPGLLGLLLFIWQTATGSLDSPLVPIFTLLVALWGTVFLELWKRRQVEHAHEWKTLGFEEEELQKELAKKYGLPQGHYQMMYLLTVPINMLVIYVVMRAMLYFMWLNDHAENVYGENSWQVYIPTVLYSIVPMIFKFLYAMLAKLLTKLEQHPTQVERDNHLLIKMFGFTFINSYIALFYIAFWLRDLERLHQMLMSIILTRAIIDQIMDYATPILKRKYYAYQREKADNEHLKIHLKKGLDEDLETFKKSGHKALESAENESDPEEKVSEPEVLHPNEMVGFTTDPKLAEKLKKSMKGTKVLKVEEKVPEDKGKGSVLDDSQQSKDSVLDASHASNTSSIQEVVSAMHLGKEWKSHHFSDIQNQLLFEIYSDKYETDMEYLELVIQFGYVSMFAVAFPLAPLLAILKNVVELQSDYWKLTKSQRPTISRRSNIGYWYTALEIISIASVLTNCGLMVMLSTYVDEYVPDEMDFLLNTDLGRVFVAIVCEHVLIGVKFLIAALIEDEPWEIQQAKALDSLDQKKWARFGRLLSHKLKVSPITELDANQRIRAEALARLGSDYRTPYAFGPMYYLPLLALPYGIAYFELSIYWVFPLGFGVLSYLQRLKDQSDFKSAMGIVSDTQVMKLLHKEMPGWFVDSEIHRMDWWNKMLQQMWFNISEYSKTIVATTVQKRLDLYRPKIFTTMEFSEVSMGSIAPKVTGLRVYDCDDDAIRMDIEFKWAGNAKFVLKIGYKNIAFFMETSNIHFVGKFRVELSPLISQVPCFGNLSFTCLSRPHLDFSFKVFGLDVMALGIGDMNLASVASTCVKTVVEKMFLYPQKYVVNVVPGHKIEGYASPIGIVQVNIKEGSELKAADFGGKSDPFVEAYVVNKNDDIQKPEEEDEILKTDIQYGTLNPKWPEKKFNFVIIDTAIDRIYFDVQDKDMMNSEPLGFTTLTLTNLQPKVRTNLWLEVSEGGKIKVEALYLPVEIFGGHDESPAETQDVLIPREDLTDKDVNEEGYKAGDESDDEEEDGHDSDEELMKEISGMRDNALGSKKQCNLMKLKVKVSKLKLPEGRSQAKPTILAKYGKLTLIKEDSEETDNENEDQKEDKTKQNKDLTLTNKFSTSINLDKVNELNFFIMDLVTDEELGHVKFEGDEVKNAFLNSSKASLSASKKASKGKEGKEPKVGLLHDIIHPKQEKTNFFGQKIDEKFGDIAIEITADREEDVLYSNAKLSDEMIELDSTKLHHEKQFSIGVVTISEVAVNEMKLSLDGHKQELFNPYVRIVQGSTARETKPANQKEEFQWPNVWNFVINELSQATIQFEIKNDVMIGDNPTIGTVVVTLDELKNSKGKMDTKRSIDDKKGNLLDTAELSFKLELRTYEGSVR